MNARHELKHSLNYADFIILRNRLRRIMKHDEHANASGEYYIRSLYFDTPNDNALADKINGVDRREKFRIRRYIHNNDYIVLEKKSKVNGLCYKNQAQITRAQLDTILGCQNPAACADGRLSWMREHQSPLARELYLKMRNSLLTPRTIVDYVREPYVCYAGEVRVTFDRQIRSGLYSTDFWDDHIPMAKAGDELVLLEVKYGQFIPEYIVDALRLPGRRITECSKYALCRMYE